VARVAFGGVKWEGRNCVATSMTLKKDLTACQGTLDLRETQRGEARRSHGGPPLRSKKGRKRERSLHASRALGRKRKLYQSPRVLSNQLLERFMTLDLDYHLSKGRKGFQAGRIVPPTSGSESEMTRGKNYTTPGFGEERGGNPPRMPESD